MMLLKQDKFGNVFEVEMNVFTWPAWSNNAELKREGPGTCSEDQTGLELTQICLPLPPERWN